MLAMNSETKAPASETPAVRVPFTQASREHTEGAFFDATVNPAAFGSGPTTIGPFDVPAFGYARDLLLLVEATGGAAGGQNAAAKPDAPWSVIRSIALVDVNGAPIVGPFSGYDLMLANKWGGYAFEGDLTKLPAYSAVATSGDFSFLIRVPLEIVAREAYGALANMNASSTYKLQITIADDSDVYSTAPNTLPSVRVRGWLEAWAEPAAQDPQGNPQEQEPSGLGTTQYWSKATYSIANGANTVRLARVGNLIRTLILVFRDSGGAREGDTFADPIQLHLDGRIVFNEGQLIRRSLMAERYGYQLASIANADADEGVIVYDFSHDFDGKPGGELGELWLPTVQSSRLEIVGSFGEAGSLEVITNDIAPAALIRRSN